MPFDRSTDLNFLRVSGAAERLVGVLTAGVGNTHGAKELLIGASSKQYNYVIVQGFNGSVNNAEYFIDFFIDDNLIVKDILVDQGSGSQESVTTFNFKSEIPKGSKLEASVRSSTDLATINIVVFGFGI